MRARGRPRRTAAASAAEGSRLVPSLVPSVPVHDDADLAGYRVVRRLAAGDHSDVYLGYSATPGMVPVALKVFRPDADADSIERQIRVLCQSPENHMVRLIDVATLSDERVCLVQERLDGRTLARLLTDRGTIATGEAVTLLAPVVAALAALHDSGLRHGAIGPAAILLHPSGRPVLGGLSAVRDLPDVPTARLRVLRDDYSGVVGLLRDVFAHLDAGAEAGGSTREAGLLVDRFEARIALTPFRPGLAELERDLFGWATATPVRLGAPEAADASRARVTPARVPVAVGGVPGTHRTGRHRVTAPERVRANLRQGHRAGGGATDAYTSGELFPDGARSAGREAFLGLPGDAIALVRGLSGSAWQLLDGHPGERLRARIGAALRVRRRPVLVAVLVGLSAVVLALTLLPPGGLSSRGQEDPIPGATAMASPPATAASGAPTAAGKPAASDDTTNGESAERTGDDPVLALPALLQARADCLAQASVICLDAVNQSGSAAMAADSYAVRMRQEGGAPTIEPDYTALTASLVERTGDVALLELTGNSKPASVLVVKGEAGWLLREIFTY